MSRLLAFFPDEALFKHLLLPLLRCLFTSLMRLT